MKKSILYLLLFFVLFTCLGVKCKKDKKPTYYMPQEFKDYVMFPFGSYWIYEDSISGEVDSLNLINFNIFIQETNTRNYDYEKMVQNFSSSKSANFSTETLRSDEYYEYYGYNENYAYYFDITTGQTSASGGIYYAKFDSLKVLDVWYKDVICIKKYGIYELYHYWVKYIGIVKSENKTNNTFWELKKYHIN